MRRYFLSISMILAATVVFAQGQNASAISYDRSPKHKAPSAMLTSLNNQVAVKVVLPYAPAAVLSAIEEYEINSYRSDKKQSDAYVAFDKTALMKNNKKGASLIFHVGPADMQRQDQSVVYMLLNTPINEGEFAGTTNQFDVNDAIAYLDNLAVAVQVINLDQQIKANMAKLKKEENQQQRFAKRCDRLNERKTAMQQKLAQNKPGAVNRDRRLGLRLTENQNVLALHKTTIEKRRTDLNQLNSQKKNFYK